MIGFLLVLLCVCAMACGGTATSTPASPTETPVATATPTLQSLGDSPNHKGEAAATPQPGAASPAIIAAETPAGSSAASPSPAAAPTGSPESLPETPTAPEEILPPIVGQVVRLGNAAFPVELALTVEQQVQGLSGRETLAPGTGMLFVYQQERQYNFWMKEMRFPLDIVWIGVDCTVVDVTLDAPPPEPDQTLDQLPRFSPGDPAQYVLEINAGEFAAAGIVVGDPVEFAGELSGRYGC